ncbi:MAG: hypothetical protein J6W64_04940 [Bacilli bacterium]|nr:hypothetical protein [Bacilli bacterium]
MRRNEGKRSIVIIGLLVLIALISIGYALMDSNLLIKGTTSVTSETWDVHFTNLRNAGASNSEITVTSPAAIKELATTPSNTADDLNIEFNISFKKPGDKYEFDVDVTNAGTLYAKCTDITTTVPESLTGLVTITYSGLAKNDILTPTGNTATKTMHVVAQYNSDVTTLPNSTVSGNLQIGVAFEQVNAPS